jgi:WD40 repeat protein
MCLASTAGITGYRMEKRFVDFRSSHSKGDILLYSNEKKQVKEVPKLHTGVINLMKWSPDGTLLITCEEVFFVKIIDL